MGAYAAFGVSLAFATFIMGVAQAFMTFFASVRLHADSITRIMHAPSSFFDTTPLGKRPFFPFHQPSSMPN